MSSYASNGLDPDVKKFLSFMSGLFGFAGYWILRAMGVPIPVLLVMFVILAVAGGLGWLIGRVLSNFVDGDGILSLCLAVSLLAAWFFAGLGILLSIVVLQLANAAYTRRKLLLFVGYFGLIASLINGGLGAAMNLKAQQARMAATTQSVR